jgi:hypothetical protein
MRWDDLQILRWIDEIEQSNQYIGNGHNLLQQLSQRAGIVWQEEIRGFAIELALAHEAATSYGPTEALSTAVAALRPDRGQLRRPGPTNDRNMWLQTIDDITLTLDGRDRARGRVIEAALPDAD